MITLPNYFEHYCPTKIVSGQRAVSNVPFEVGRMGCSKAFIITEKGAVQAAVLKAVQQAFSDSDFKIGYIFDEAVSEPHGEMAARVAEIFRRKGCDVFIAIGSGACMDLAKAANIIAAGNGSGLAGINDIATDLYKMVAIPVAFTAGNQTTGFVVIREGSSDLFFKSDRLYPNMAVIDPRAALNADPATVATAAAVAFGQAIDAYFMQQVNPVVGIYARAAIEMLRKYAPLQTRAVRRAESDGGLANANLFAGIAFSAGASGLIAASAYAIASVCKLPVPRVSTALLVPAFEFYTGRDAAATMNLVGILAGSGTFLDHGSAALAVSRKFSDLFNSITDQTGLKTKLGAYGVTAEDLKEAAKLAASADCPFYGAKAFSVKEVSAVMNAAL